jgi:peptide/nickel transport system substrate-binding protein
VRSPGLAGFASLALVALACDRAPSPAASPAPRAVRVAVPAGLLSLDVLAPEHEEFALSILRNVYEPLVELGDDFGPRPVLAESWHSPDDHTWVFRLRPGVRLHDGRVLDAGMVAAAINRHLALPWGVNLLQPVAKVEAEGPRDVVFRTRGVFLSLPERLATFLVDGGGDAAGRAVGTGRYRVVDWRPDGRVALEGFALHRDGGPAVERIEFLPAGDGAERVRLLRQGEAQLALDVPPDAMVQLAGEGFATHARPGLRVVFLGLNGAPGRPFHDRRVREAITRGIDRAGLVAGPLRGFGEPTLQLPADGQMGHDRSLAVPPGDATGARALLAAAGYPANRRLQLDYVPGKYLEIEAVVRALATQLAAAGFDVVPRPRRYVELIADVESGRSSFYVLGWLDDSRAADSAYAALLHTPGPRFGSVNGSRYSNARFDELVEQAEIEEDAPHRGEMLREATRIVTEDWPLVPLYRQSDLYAHDRKLGFRPRLDRRVRGWELALLP